MTNKIKSLTAKFMQQHIQKRRAFAVLAALALVAAGGTIWALVRPASTMSGEIVCGMEEHTHTEQCYELRLTCGQEESEAHTHGEQCWQKELICPLPEHTHSEQCYGLNETQGESEPTQQTEKPEGTEATEGAEITEGTEVTQGTETLPSEQDSTQPVPQDPDAEPLPEGVPEEYTDLREAKIGEAGTVRVYAKPETIPEKAELKVQILEEDSEEFLAAGERLKENGVTYDFMKALDISLYDEKGEEIEPQAPVYVFVDMNGLLPEEANPETIQIQHHKEILPFVQQEEAQSQMAFVSQEPEVVLESVMDDTKGVLVQNEETGACAATFPVESFSVYTITSSGWPTLKIRVQCVDEYGNELLADHKPDDIHWGDAYKPGASFSVIFMSQEHPEIPNYQYDGKAYFMRNGNYESRIYGISRNNNKWYYFPKDNDKNTKSEFKIQPDFEVKNEPNPSDPPDFIRLVYKKVTDIPVQYMDDAGGYEKREIPLSLEDAPNGKNPERMTYTGTELDISNTDMLPKSQTYFFVGRAYAGAPEHSNEVVKVIRENGQPYGVTQEGKKILLSDETPLKLVYHKTQTGTPDVMTTVPTRDKGMIINLFDYNSGNSATANELINEGKKLHFGPYSDGYIEQHGDSVAPYNQWTGKDGGIYTGIVGDTLVNGYPTVDGQSLDYLFDPDLCRKELRDDGSGKVKHVHTKLDNLFWQDKDGYYRYDSMTNFATIMDENEHGGGHKPGHTEGGNFIVYQQPALPGYNGVGDNAKFLPFDRYEDANKLKEPNQPAKKEYHFGMTMETPFIMPPGGVVADADGSHTGMRDMIFEFNGDDDVWVFIDGKLVLDLGGIHDRYGGTINFRTGEVTTNAPPMEHSGLRQKNLYNIEGDPNTMTEAELAEAREKAGFGKFSQHDFKFFYLERGKGSSNCEIRFNLVPVEHNLVVGKRIPRDLDGAATEHMWYQFQVEAEHNGESHPLADAAYTLVSWNPEDDPVNGGRPIGAGKTDQNGRFWLRAGERADFSGALDLKHAGAGDNDNIRILVSEVFSDGSVVPQVTAWSGKEDVQGTYLEVKDASGKIRKLVPPMYDSQQYNFHTKDTKTEVINLPGTGETICQAVVTTGRENEFNWIDFENDLGALSGLNITKHARHTGSAETPISGVPFAIKVELWDTKAKSWVPLPVGSDYWILKPGEKPENSPKLQLKESDRGLISIQDSETIHLHVLPGTKYRVSEVLSLEEAAVYVTTYEGSTNSASEELEPMLDAAGNQVGIGNKIGISAGGQHYITITNKGDPIVTPNGSFVLTKEVHGVIPPDTKFQFNLGIKDYFTDDATGGYLPELHCKATYYGFPKGTREGDPKHGHEETLIFTPTTTSGGTGGTPAKGENYQAGLFLYPGEIVVIKNLPDGKSMYVQEIFGEDQTGHYEVSFREDGNEPVVGTEIDVISPIGSDHVVKVTCVNRSNLRENSVLQLSKKVKRTDQPDGKPLTEDLEKPFHFSITLKKPSAFAADQVSAKLVAANGIVTYLTLKFEPNGEDYVANVSLKHGETMTITGLPVNVQVVVQENGHNGYAAFMNEAPGDCITVDLKHNTGAPYQIQCVNMTGAELPETGGYGRLPHYLLGTILMCAAGLLLYRRRKTAA